MKCHIAKTKRTNIEIGNNATKISFNSIQTLALQQIAIGKIINWLYGYADMDIYNYKNLSTSRQLEEAITRMKEPNEISKDREIRIVYDFSQGVTRLRNFMAKDISDSKLEPNMFKENFNMKAGFQDKLDEIVEVINIRNGITPSVRDEVEKRRLLGIASGIVR